VKLINRIESLDRTSANNAVSPIASPYQKGSMLTEQLIDSLKMQVAGLNQSLVSMQAKFTEEIDSLATGIPLSALGSTVIYYNINAAELNSEDKQRLALLSQKLKSDQSVILHIKGFTDQTGNAASNLALSRKRAENVKNYFVSQIGIKPDQILINYFGQQKASSGKDNPYDRRVEIELFRQ
jgi:outer membrane protein OmpA-like peptidoglycan-associated protein